MTARPVFAVVTHSPSAFSNRRIAEACARNGFEPLMLDLDALDILVDDAGARSFYHGVDLAPPAVFYARTGGWTSAFGLAVIAQMEATPGVVVLNGADHVAAARDKLRGQQRLLAAGLPVPATALLRDPADARAMAARLGGPPLVVKVLAGTKGEGVMLARTADELQAAIDVLWSAGTTLLLQEFVEESEGRDVRVLVVGDRVLGAMLRQAPAGEFRANVAQGAKVASYRLDPEVEAYALRATAAMGLDIAGVDLLLRGDGYVVIEVNSAPGFEGFERATGVDVADAIVQLGRWRMGA